MEINENMKVTNESKGYLTETAKWAKFLAILGFVGIGLMILAAFFMGTLVSVLPSTNGAEQLPVGFMSFFYFILAGLYFIPVNYLYKFAKKTTYAISDNSSEGLARAFENLKSHYKFIGIFTLVILSIYALLLLVAIFGGIAAASF